MKQAKIILMILCLSLVHAPTNARQNVIRPAVGDTAPDINMTNAKGEIISLSSLRGKVVLVDFWASWCRTCRIENNTVRQAYTTYKNRNFSAGNGFDVFSVSLDEDKDVWKKAIHNDRLEWIYHVCDFKKWDSPVVSSYNFRSLPHNVLIDADGKILAKGLYGKKLSEFLESILAE